MAEYPYNEGDVYYTIEDGTIIESVWDDVSEEIFDTDKVYYDTLQEAYDDYISRGEGLPKLSLLN